MTKFLIIRFSSIGDIILTTPVVRCIKQQVPDAEVHYLTKSSFAFLLKNNPYIDQIHILKESLFDTLIKLKAEGFDNIIDLHNNLRTLICKSVLGIDAFTFDKLNFEKTVLTKSGINILPQLHIVDRYLQTVESFGVKSDGKGLEYFFDEAELDQFKRSEFYNLTNQTYVAVAIGAQHATKRMPAEKLIELCNKIDAPILLLGGKDDKETGDIILKGCKGKIHNLCGSLSFDASAYVIQNAAHVITHDTGLMHVAAAFNKPMQVIWGNTVPELGMYPYYSNTSTLLAANHEVKLKCRPCSKIGYNSCPKGHFNCMMLQNTDVIANNIFRAMGRPEGAP